MLMPISSVVIESDVFAFLIELRGGRGGKALRQGGLTIKLVRKFARRKHRLGMGASRTGQAGIECEAWCAGLRPGLIREIEKLLFGAGVVGDKRNVGRAGGRGL